MERERERIEKLEPLKGRAERGSNSVHNCPSREYNSTHTLVRHSTIDSVIEFRSLSSPLFVCLISPFTLKGTALATNEHRITYPILPASLSLLFYSVLC